MKKTLRVVSTMTLCAMLVGVMMLPGVQAAYTGTEFVGDLGRTNLVGHWKLDDILGWAVNSADTGSTYNGTVYGTPTRGVSGKIDDCYDFDGTDDYVSVPDGNNDLDFGQNVDFSVFCWINIHDVTSVPILNKYGSNKGYSMSIDSNGYLQATIYTGPWSGISATGTSTIADSEWHHAGLVRTGTTIEAWVDGIRENTNTGAGGSLANNANLLLGKSGSSYLDGNIDDVRIYNAAIDPTATMISHWDMEDGRGQIVSDVVGSNDGLLGTTDQSEACDPTWDTTDYKVGSCSLDFYAYNSQLVTVRDNPTLNFSSGDDFSIFCWINIRTYAGSIPILIKYASYYGYKMSTSSGHLQVTAYKGFGSTVSATGTSVIADGNWYHVGLVRSGDTLEAWVDGFCEGTNTGASGDLSNTGNLLFGTDGSYYLDGNIDDVIIFSEAVVPAA